MNLGPFKCPIWGTDADGMGSVNDPRWIIVRDSARAGGGYRITVQAAGLVSGLEDREKARLTTWLVNSREQGDTRPVVSVDDVAYVQSKRPMSAHERAERLLQYIGRESTEVGSWVVVESDTSNAYAWSESTKWEEVQYLLDYLEESGWIRIPGHLRGSRVGPITVEGYSRLEKLETRIDPSRAFVAMWFDQQLDDAYDRGFVPGIQAAGYEPDRIDRDLSVEKIDDAIIAKIKQSSFVVADFTQGTSGARGSVYFEAGFAHGLGKPVFFTCRNDQNSVDGLAFDTRQYSHIFWDTPEGLCVDLANRIRARFGQGPKANH